MKRARLARIPVLLALALLPPALGGADPFVFVSLPDTQVYAENRLPDGRFPAVTDTRGTGAIFFDQTGWIARNARKRGIRYVGHLGDIVQNGDDLVEWELAKHAMNVLLDADIPHGTVMGNHDDNHGPDYQRNYLDHFGPQVFAGRPWYAASSPGGGANLQLLEHEGVKLGFLNFSIDHPQSEVDWATGVVEDHPDTIFIIGTHRYLFDFKLAAGRYGEPLEGTVFGDLTIQDNFVNGVVEPNDAQELFDEFVTQHPNILMIHAGHFHAEWLRLDGQNAAAQTIIQILTDYQSTRNGGDGWLRIYELDFENGTFGFETWSPTLERRRTTIDHFVETIFLAWDQRDQIMQLLGIDEPTYLVLLDALLKNTPAPDGFLLQHPDFDEPEERAYYDRYLSDLFLGSPLPFFSDIAEWEGLWLQAFAIDPQDPFDFRDWVRSPNGSLPVDYSAYFTPSLEQQLFTKLDEIQAALDALEPGDLAFPAAKRVLARRVAVAARKADQGRFNLARRLLRRAVLRRIDGCALRGEPDTRRGFDFIAGCPAQAQVHPLVVEALSILRQLGPARRP